MKKHTLITAIVFIGIIVILAVIMGGFADQLAFDNQDLHDRATQIYDNNEYVIVSSSACYDFCAPTAITREQQREDLFRVLRQNEGWSLDEYELSSATAGSVSDIQAPLSDLVASGWVVRQERDGFSPDLYRTRAGDPLVAPVSDERVRERVRTRLYLVGGSMSANELSRDLPVSEERVKTALESLERAGLVDGGYVSYMWIPSYEYVDVRHGSLPDHWLFTGLVGPFVIVLVGVVLIGLIRRYQSTSARST